MSSARGRAALAIAAVFFVNGASLSSWTPRLPELQAELGISDAALGLTLLGGGIGGLLASLVSGWCVDRRGSRTMTVTTSAVMCVCLPLLGTVPTAGLVFATLIVIGAFDGLTDVAMNAQAVELQRQVGRSVITRFHAVWSAGAVTGGIVASRAAAAGISIRTQLLVTAAVLVATTVVAAFFLLPDHSRHHGGPVPSQDVPARQAVYVRLFLVGLAVALAELPPFEWAALMMSERFDITAGQAGLGFVAVAGGMLAGRVIGDHLTDRFGLERTRRGGAALAATGVVLATLLPHPLGAGCGLFVAGLGLSSLFPLLFRAASDLTHGSHGGMAAFSSGARLGFLLVSPLMGLVAQRTSVATAMLAIAGTAAVAVAVSRIPRTAEAELAPAAT
jgi:predicted MFS family arabinose efflux permease